MNNVYFDSTSILLRASEFDDSIIDDVFLGASRDVDLVLFILLQKYFLAKSIYSNHLENGLDPEKIISKMESESLPL